MFVSVTYDPKASTAAVCRLVTNPVGGLVVLTKMAAFNSLICPGRTTLLVILFETAYSDTVSCFRNSTWLVEPAGICVLAPPVAMLGVTPAGPPGLATGSDVRSVVVFSVSMALAKGS